MSPAMQRRWSSFSHGMLLWIIVSLTGEFLTSLVCYCYTLHPCLCSCECHQKLVVLETRGVVTALKPVRAEQVWRPERKQNWTVPHCRSVLPICLSLRPVGSIHISCLAAREQTSASQIAKASPPYNMKYFYSFLALSFNSIFNFF